MAIAPFFIALNNQLFFRNINMINPSDFSPQSIDDCVFGNNDSKVTLENLVNNKLPFPAFGKSGILLYGA